MELSDIVRRARGITANSGEVREGFIFFALRGSRWDGHDFVDEAVKRGASYVVVERPVSARVPVVVVENSRKALGMSAHLFFGKPSERIRVVGVTGTNGKTTTTHVIESILSAAGRKCGLIGTIHYRLGERILGEGRTTPDPVLWHGTLREFERLGASYAVAEVSSHALDQYRIYPTRFRAVIFTNLSQDHLDYHATMEEYFRAKSRLFTEYESEYRILNADDPYGRKLAESLEGAITYGKEGDIKIRDFSTSYGGSLIELEFRGKRYRFFTNLIGDFQAYNIAPAVGFALLEGIEEEAIAQALKSVRVPGRFEVVWQKEFTVVVDYAHTPDAMENFLRTARKLTRNRLITVFGAGGNRDREKRPLMGRAAERWSDVVVITSDNPRDEDPLRIIEDILKGVEKREKVRAIPDRREAIEFALSIARKGDLVAILGKGHEDYQEVKGVKYPFNDAEVVRELLGGDDCTGIK